MIARQQPRTRAYTATLEADRSARCGVEKRVDLRLGWMDEAEKVLLLARCLAVAVPAAGRGLVRLPVARGVALGKAIVTLVDSGGRPGVRARRCRGPRRPSRRPWRSRRRSTASTRTARYASEARRGELSPARASSTSAGSHVVQRLVGHARVKLLVANNAAPFVRGGAELLADRLVLELRGARARGGAAAAAARRHARGRSSTACSPPRRCDAINVDRIIGLKFPAYLLPHDDVVDLARAPVPAGLRPRTRCRAAGQSTRSSTGGRSDWPTPAASRRARRLYAISPVVAERLRAVQRPRGRGAADAAARRSVDYRCEPAEPTTSSPWAGSPTASGRRLAVEAMAHAAPGAPARRRRRPRHARGARGARAGDRRGRALGDRVELIPRFITDEEKLDLMARCTASVYLPIDEDSYGYVCYEAAMSSQADDHRHRSGGTADAGRPRRHRASSSTARPGRRSAAAFDRMLADPERAAEMGRARASDGPRPRSVVGARRRGADAMRVAHRHADGPSAARSPA